jgi:hypothetical protein
MTGKPYFWPFPVSGTILPDSQATLRISLMVDDQSAKHLTLGEEDLNGKVDLLH